jgi:hypothetical protein
MRLSFALVVAVALGVSPFGGEAPALAGVQIVSQGVEVDRAAGVAHFHALFDARPDLWTMDEFGRLKDSFQYEIDDDWRAAPGLPPEGLDSVIRGDEVHVANALRVRDARFGTTPDPDPDAGGWGAVRDEVAMNWNGNELRFAAPLGALGDDDGYFAYRLFTTEYGLTVSEVEARLLPPGEPGPGTDPGPRPAPMPLPPAAAAAALTAAIFCAGTAARRFACPGRPK